METSNGLKFVCPKCGGTELEEIQVNGVISTPVNDIEDGVIIYGDSSIDSGLIDRFQCFNCGWIIKDGKYTIQTIDDFVNWLVENGMAKGETDG